VSTLELAPRPSMSWLRGEPALRVWADSELGVVDGVVALGAQSSFVGRVDGVPLERLPLRVDSSGVALSGRCPSPTRRAESRSSRAAPPASKA
jgi:hypothetical protein